MIELTIKTNGSKILINIALIESINFNFITFAGGGVEVKESYEEIKQLIENGSKKR